jgi:hypothetical protein
MSIEKIQYQDKTDNKSHFRRYISLHDKGAVHSAPPVIKERNRSKCNNERRSKQKAVTEFLGGATGTVT